MNQMDFQWIRVRVGNEDQLDKKKGKNCKLYWDLFVLFDDTEWMWSQIRDAFKNVLADFFR